MEEIIISDNWHRVPSREELESLEEVSTKYWCNLTHDCLSCGKVMDGNGVECMDCKN